ncbi:NUMOD4 domain-containing protein [Mycobacterium sp. 852002-51971_SCH5477799-a]|uniref:NUMOD4 domain-containing protein n=1 Tax=Mycobacterium sp. 852002-51971_SCH5477799-a TaxID=1834106 RepID=UPI0009EDDD64
MDEGSEREQWRPVRGFEGLYEVSDQGRVRSLDRWVAGRSGRRQFMTGRIKSLPKLKQGYPVVHLVKDGRATTKTVHTVMLEAFVGPRPAGHVGCHNDGDPSNNRLTNLRWDTQSNNLLDAIRHGTHSRFLVHRDRCQPREVVLLEGERWKPVVGFGRFEVSDQGRVRSPAGRVLSARVKHYRRLSRRNVECQRAQGDSTRP